MSDFNHSLVNLMSFDVVKMLNEKKDRLIHDELPRLRKKRMYDCAVQKNEPVPAKRFWQERTWRKLSYDEASERWNNRISLCTRAELYDQPDYIGFHESDPWRDHIESEIRRCERMIQTIKRSKGRELLMSLEDVAWITK